MVATLLAAMVVAQARPFLINTSATYDEPLHMRLGLEVYRGGSFAGFIKPMTPPLAILIAYWQCALVADEPVPRLHEMARWAHVALVAVPLVLLVYAWLARRRGMLAGALGGALVACSPNVLAHAAIAATDTSFALFSLAALAVIDRYQRRPSPWWLCGVGVATGLALAAKQSAVFLLPTFVAVLVWLECAAAEPSRRRAATRIACRLVIMGGVALLTCWACYGFATTAALPSDREQAAVAQTLGTSPAALAAVKLLNHLRIPAPVYAIGAQLGHAVGGHEAFLLGQRSHQGWWYYFPVAIALKGTPTDWLLFAAASVLVVRGAIWRDPTSRLWAVAGGLYFALCLTSRLNLGVRYLSVLYPLLMLFSVDGLCRELGSRSWTLVCAGGILVGLQFGNALWIAPHYLSYLNPLLVRPEQGYRYLVDSNLDWGQDLPELARTFARLHVERPRLAYFGTVTPEAYGIHAGPWDEPGGDYLAVSATYLQGVGLAGDPFARLRRLPPDARAGYSVFVYDLRRDDVAAAVRCRENKRPDPPPR